MDTNRDEIARMLAKTQDMYAQLQAMAEGLADITELFPWHQLGREHRCLRVEIAAGRHPREPWTPQPHLVRRLAEINGELLAWQVDFEAWVRARSRESEIEPFLTMIANYQELAACQTTAS